MATQFEDKELIIGWLQKAEVKTLKLAMRLQIAGQHNEAEKLRKLARKISRLIDVLVGDLMRAWSIDAQLSVKALKRSTEALQRSIKAINDRIKIKENAIKAIGKVDEIVEIAKDIIDSVT